MDHAILLARQGSRAEAGRLSVGYIFGTETGLFSKLIPALKQSCPEMQISYHAMNEPELIAALDESEIDVAFLPGPIENAELCSEVILRQRLVVVLASSHPLAKMKKIPPARLVSVPFLRPMKSTHPKYMKFINDFAEHAGVQFKSNSEHDNVLSALHAVGLGLGFSLIPDYQTDILPRSVVFRPLDVDPQPTFNLLMAYHKSDRTPALKLFLSAARASSE